MLVFRAFAAVLAATVVIAYASGARAQVNCTTFTATDNGTSTATVVYDDAIVVSGITYDLRGTTTTTTGAKVVTFTCSGGLVRVQVQSATGSAGSATVMWEALDDASNAIVLQNFFFELIDLDGPNIEYSEFQTEASYCTDSTGTVQVTVAGTTVRVDGTVNDPADAAQINGSGGTSFEILYGVDLATSTDRFFDHGLMTGTAADLLDTCVGCGTGVVDPDEGCDDNNWGFGDGCSSGCLVEIGFACGTTGLMGSDSCVVGAGCNTTGGPPGICTSLCGDGNLDPGEACDDGNSINTDACSNDCLVNLGFGTCSSNIDCVNAASGVECNSGVCELGLEEGICNGPEDCEGALVCRVLTGTCLIADGNGTCTADSNCESGNCDIPSGICQATTCGDSIVEGTEECDDGGTTAGDGCDADCNLEPGCFLQTPSFAVSQTNVGADNPDNALGAPQLTVAGSAELRGGDSIDLFFDVTLPAGTTVTIYAATNNNSNGSMTISESSDGMTFGSPQTFNSFAASNTIEQVTYVTSSGDVAYVRVERNTRRIYVDAITFSQFFNCDTCGDGVIDVGEECDDNNSTSGDGCSDNCIVDPGATCSGEPSFCEFPPSHTTMGSLLWKTGDDGTIDLELTTVSQAGALEYRVGWADGDVAAWETGVLTALPSPSGGVYEVSTPPGHEPWTRAIRIEEADSQGATHLVFEGIVPPEGISLARSPKNNLDLRAATRLKNDSAGAPLAPGFVDSVAVHIPSAGIFAIELDALSAALDVDSVTFQRELEAGQWGMTAEGIAVPTAFDPDDQVLYIASRWREDPASATIAHLLQPIAESRAAVVHTLPLPEAAAEPAGAYAAPYAADPMVRVAAAVSEGPDVVAISEASAFEGHVEMDFELDEFAGLAAAPPSDREFWFWDVLSGTSADTRTFAHEFETQGQAWQPDADLHLRVFVAPSAGGQVDQTLQLWLNDVLAGEAHITAVGVRTVIFKNIGALSSGLNRLELIALGPEEADNPPAGFVFLDGFALQADAEWPAMEREPPTSIFSATSVVVSGEGSRSLGAAKTVFDLQQDRFVIAAEGFAPRAKAAGSYLISTETARPVLRGFLSGSRDALLDERVEHVVFAALGFESAGERLSSWRRSEGMASRTVRLPEVFDRFGAGNPDIDAVREYLLAYRERWDELPAYVVLLGAGTFERSVDPSEAYAGVPPSMMTTYDGVYASHVALSELDQDGIEQVAVGQIPARSLEEAHTVVDKIEHFESVGQQAWAGKPVVLAAGEDRGISFSRVMDTIHTRLDNTVIRETIDANELGASEARTAFLDHLRRGASWFNYIGHGSFAQLGDGPIVSQSDLEPLVASLDDSGSYSFFTSMSCTTSRSEVPGFESIAEQLLKIDRGGAIVAWGPSGTSRPVHTLVLSEALGNALADFEADDRIGDVVRTAKRQAHLAGTPKGEFDVFVLFGDPATKLPSLARAATEGVDTHPTAAAGGCTVGSTRDRNGSSDSRSAAWLLCWLGAFVVRRSFLGPPPLHP